MIRRAAVAGKFYEKDKDMLIRSIERCFLNEKIGPGKLPETKTPVERSGNIYGLVSPHAGYVYSGPVAAHAYLAQFMDGKPEFFVIIGPNHTNLGPGISVYPEGGWETPLGVAEIPEDIAQKIIKQPHFRGETTAHVHEHSIEVQVPFLQYLYGGDVPIIPICLKDQSNDNSIRVGNVLSKVLKKHDYCIIASTDLTHFKSQAESFALDQYVIENIRNLNATGLQEVVAEYHITMCGPGAVSSVLTACHHNNVNQVEILKYATSGDVSGDKDHVVSYLSALLKKK